MRIYLFSCTSCSMCLSTGCCGEYEWFPAQPVWETTHPLLLGLCCWSVMNGHGDDLDPASDPRPADRGSGPA